MCIEDVRLGRKTGAGSTTATTVFSEWTQFLSQDSSRVSIIFPPLGLNSGVRIRPFGLGPEDTVTISIYNTSEPLLLNIRDHGALVMSAWEVFHVGIDPITAYWTRLDEK